MKKTIKYIIPCIIFVILFLFITILGIRIYSSIRMKKIDTSDYDSYYRQIYGVICWSRMCEEKNIPYDHDRVDEVIQIYNQMKNYYSPDKSDYIVDLTYAYALRQLTGDNSQAEYKYIVKQFDSKKNSLSPDIFYGPTTIDDFYFCYMVFQKAHLEIPDWLYNYMVDYYNYNSSKDFSVSKAEWAMFLLWDTNQCRDIDITPAREYLLLLYKDCLAYNKLKPLPPSADVLDMAEWEMLQSLGEDISEIQAYNEATDFCSDPQVTIVDLQDGSRIPDMYYEAFRLEDPDFFENEEFLRNFGNSLTQYCEYILIPELHNNLNIP